MAMTVPAREVRVGDRLQPMDCAPGSRRLRVTDVRDYSTELATDPEIYVVYLAGWRHSVAIYLRDEPVVIERRPRAGDPIGTDGDHDGAGSNLSSLNSGKGAHGRAR